MTTFTEAERAHWQLKGLPCMPEVMAFWRGEIGRRDLYKVINQEYGPDALWLDRGADNPKVVAGLALAGVCVFDGASHDLADLVIYPREEAEAWMKIQNAPIGP